MARKKPPGLVKRAGIWHIDERINGQRVCQSTGADRLDEAERFLARLTEHRDRHRFTASVRRGPLSMRPQSSYSRTSTSAACTATSAD